MKTNLTKYEALEIAKKYKKEHNLGGTFDDDIDKVVTFYNDFYGLKGAIWLVMVRQKDLEDWNNFHTYSYLISDDKKEIEHLIDSHGNIVDLSEYDENALDILWDSDEECIEHLQDPEKRKLLSIDDIEELLDNEKIRSFLSDELIEELERLVEESEEE